jgi:hypothetical protein
LLLDYLIAIHEEMQMNNGLPIDMAKLQKKNVQPCSVTIPRLFLVLCIYGEEVSKILISIPDDV